MKKRNWIIVAAAVVVAAAVCVVLLVHKPQEGSTGILYRVTGGESTAYLLGSIHIGTGDMYPFGDTLMDALAGADTFVFESDTRTDENVQRLMTRMTLPKDATLRDILGDDLMDEVLAAYDAIGIPAAMIDAQQPWVVISTLSVYSSAVEMGIDNVSQAISLGVDHYVLNYADKHQKQLAYLETIDEFADMMESFTPDLTRYLIQDEVNWILHREDFPAISPLKQWPALWSTGDAGNFWASYQQSISYTDKALYGEYEDKVLTRRNVLMADRLDAMFQEGGTYFVTIGLLHLIYEGDNIPELLREKGYTVERVLD
jgi:uncharacterized protein